MSQIRAYVCEVCGKQEPDNTEWFLVAGDRSTRSMEVLHWDDKLAGQSGICHVCCAEHVQQLAGAWTTPQPHSYLHLAPLRRDQPEENLEQRQAAALLGELSMNRAWLNGGLDTDDESLAAILDALEVVLQNPTEEEDEILVFDA